MKRGVVIEMNGSQIKFINLCLRLLTIDILFGILPITLYDLTIEEMVVYYGILLVTSLCCIAYCYCMIFIKYQSNNICKKTKRKLDKNNFYKLDDCPIYSTYKSDGYGYLAKELYLTCKEEQRKLFEEKGYVIIVGSKEELKCFAKQKFINGYFSRVDKYILVYTECETSDRKPYDIKLLTRTSFSSTFWHEWGHFVDFANNYISNTREFIKYFNDRKAYFKHSVRFMCAGLPSLYCRKYPKINLYELSSTSEFFACKYSDYKMNRPLSEYLKNMFDELEDIENVTCSEEV